MPGNVINVGKFEAIELGSSHELTRRHGRLQIHQQCVSVGRLPKNVGASDVSTRPGHVIDDDWDSEIFLKVLLNQPCARIDDSPGIVRNHYMDWTLRITRF